MADNFYPMKNQLKFNLGVPLVASNINTRYSKPRPIIVERAGGHGDNIPGEKKHDNKAHNVSASSDKMALAVRLAQRDLKLQREGRSKDSNCQPAVKSSNTAKHPATTKGGTKIVHTREAKERDERLQEKRRTRDPLKVREQGWNAGVARTQTPPRSQQPKPDLPATTNSPPTRDTDRYPRGSRLDDPWSEIGRLQSDMESYLQQVQVMEQQACNDPTPSIITRTVTRQRAGYLDSEEDPARLALRQEEHATRAARQVYFLQQQVRSLDDDLRKRGSNVKHTKKSQIVTRLAAAHRGAVRALQTFVTQQLPLHDLRRGLPGNYHELAPLIKQLVLISTQIQGDRDTAAAQQDLVKLVDRVTELNEAWCQEQEIAQELQRNMKQSRPITRDVRSAPAGPANKATRRVGKENRPKGVLKKQLNRGKQTAFKGQKTRQLTPERQNVLRAGLEALTRQQPSNNGGGVAWNISADDSMLTDAGPTALILPKPLQHKRERAQRGVTLSVPETHFSDPTLASSLKEVHPEEVEGRYSNRDPWRPGGSLGKSPSRSRSAERNRSNSRSRSNDRSRSRDRCRSQSPTSRQRVYSQALNEDTELMRELFPHGVDGERSRRSRSRSPPSRSRPRSRSPGIPHYRTSPRSPHTLASRLKRLQLSSEERGMIDERDNELSEIKIRQMLAESARQGDVDRDQLADMILNDVLAETAAELQSLEGDEEVEKGAELLSNQPTLENLYQRLEQMEMEQLDIRRRWGTIHFEEEKSSRRKVRKDELPGKPVAMEISKKKPASQSLREDRQGEYNRERASPIIFTNTAPLTKYRKPVDSLGLEPSVTGVPSRFQMKTKLKISESTVRDIKANVERFERHLRNTSQQPKGKFDPWSLVEEIADQVLSECISEIDKELEDIGENIVHQLCKAEFSLPNPMPSQSPSHSLSHAPSNAHSQSPGKAQGNYFSHTQSNVHSNQQSSQLETSKFSQRPIARDHVDYTIRQPGASERWASEPPALNVAISHVTSTTINSIADISGSDRKFETGQIEAARSVELDDNEATETKSKTKDKSGKKGVSFDQEISYELSYERETVFDAANLEMDTPRDGEVEEEDGEYEDDEEEEEEDVEEVSPIDSDDLEYSTDET